MISRQQRAAVVVSVIGEGSSDGHSGSNRIEGQRHDRGTETGQRDRDRTEGQ